MSNYTTLKDVLIMLFDGYRIRNNITLQYYLTSVGHIDKIRELCHNIDISNSDTPINITTLIVDSYITFMKDYFMEVNASVMKMHSYPNHPQRSLEWFQDRQEKISASSIYKVLKDNFDKDGLKFEKIGIQMPMFGYSNPIMHGVMFEQVSQVLYETRNGVKIIEFGCIPHSTHSYIGASPDGVVFLPDIFDKTKNYTLEQVSLHGRLIEIKNPYSRVINSKIPAKYECQINAQQEVCGLPICDYLETNYNFYDCLEAFLDDTYDLQGDNISLSDATEHLQQSSRASCNTNYTDCSDFSDDCEDEPHIDNSTSNNSSTISEYNGGDDSGDNYSIGDSNDSNDSSIFDSTNINNLNIPWVNLNNKGDEKGILIKFSNNYDKYAEYKYEGVMFDINIPYDYDTIMSWVNTKTVEMNEKGLKLEKIFYWSVKVYDVKTVFFDNQMWSDIQSRSAIVWDEIVKERQLTDTQLLKKYKGKLEVITPPITSDDGDESLDNNKKDKTLFRNRNLKKYVKPRQSYDNDDGVSSSHTNLTYDF